ncbi:MAG: hypothetical protein NZ930_04825, partial [Candidatus Bipolaricaulota bacterium]|nr:hypothetical protein [Candidatus Bipolaricaulota bacterium]
AQSVGATTLDKGLLYLAVGESSGLTLRPTVSYYRMELSVSGKESYRMQRAPLEICAASKDEIKTPGFPDGAIMSVVGVYEASAEDKLELQVVRPPRDPCVLGLSALACLDTQRWLPRLIEEKSEQSNMSTLESFNWALSQEGVEGGVLYVEDVEKATKLLLAGYRDLTLEQIETLLKAANVLNAGVPQSLGPFSPICTEQQPTPAQLIQEAEEFLIRLGRTETLRFWDDAAKAIGLNRVLPRVGEFSGQDWFNYQVALFVLSVKESVVARLIDTYRAGQILGPRLQYVLEQIRLAAVNFPSSPEYYGARVQAWLDKITVAARTHSIHDPSNQWFLLDFLRMIDYQGNELTWPTWDNPPLRDSQMIDVVVLKLGFTGHPSGTLLAFLRVDSSRPDRGHFNDPLGQYLNPEAKANQIISWLKAVYNHIAQETIPRAAFYWHGMKILGWIFTNPQNPAMMHQLITLVQQRWPGSFPYPFFIAYVADGRPEVVCFGCSTQAEIWAAWLIACQMGGICVQNVQVVRSDGVQSPSNMLFPTPGDPSEIGTVTPSTGSLLLDIMADGGGGGGDSTDPCNQN